MPGLQTDAERAATNTIHWLQSCNACVILDSGGVNTFFAMLPICCMSIILHLHCIHLCAQFSAVGCLTLIATCIALYHLYHHVWFVGSNLFVCTGAQPSLLDCKLSTGLRMPEDLAAVAHGDATLNLDNFMHQFRV